MQCIFCVLKEVYAWTVGDNFYMFLSVNNNNNNNN